MGPLTEAVTRRLELAEVPSSAGRGAPSEEDADGLVIASAPAPAWRRPGPGPTAAGLRRIGPYEIVAELARGGMGVVYLCRRAGEAGFERLLAVKHLHTHLAGDAEFVAMLLDEARLAARIHHHNVASVVELGYFEWGYYLVMPYVEGCALGELLARNPDHRPPSLLVPILIEALDGLHAAHVTPGPDGAPAGVVHRDVSPANILVGVDGAARITDFGVAKARTRITSSAQGTIKGTLCYAAPEVYRGADRRPGRRVRRRRGAVERADRAPVVPRRQRRRHHAAGADHAGATRQRGRPAPARHPRCHPGQGPRA